MLLALILWLGTAEVTLPNGLTTHYADSGKGEAIVLISGLASRLQSWDAVVPLLEPHFRVIRPDNRGVGDSGDLEGAYSVDTMAEDVALLMAALEIEHYNVAGLSLGSFAGQALALQHPDRVKHLILIGSSPGGTAHVPPDAEVLAFFQTFFTVPAQDRAKQGLTLSLHPDFIEKNPEIFQALVDSASASTIPAPVLMRQGMAGMSFNHAEAARQIAVPTLILHGDSDRIILPANGEKLHELIPGSQLYLIPDSGHISIIDQPQATATQIIQFIEGQ